MARGKFLVTAHITDGPEVGEVVDWDVGEADQIPWALQPVAEPKKKAPAKKAAPKKTAGKARDAKKNDSEKAAPKKTGTDEKKATEEGK